MLLKDDWITFPEGVKLFVLNEAEDLTWGVIRKFELNDTQAMFIFDLLDEVFLKRVKPLNFPNELDKIKDAKSIEIRLLALDLAHKILWPLQEYLEEIDRLILRLGGKVPQLRRLKGTSASEQILTLDNIVGTVKELMSKHRDFKEQRLTSNKIVDKRAKHVAPTVDNWIKDYVHFSGAGQHGSLQRAQYLSKSSNILALSKEELNSLRFFLTSYDDSIKVSFNKKKGKLIVSEVIDVKAEKEDVSIDNLLREFQNQLEAIEKDLLASQFILSEADNNLQQVRDILWKAIGVQDKAKALSCVRVLIEKRSLDIMLQEDNRFKSILKRFISIKYGNSMADVLDRSIDKLLVRRLFLEMLLVDKLSLTEQETVLTAFYLTNLVSGANQLVYLDKGDNKLKWRELQVTGNNIVWVHEIA